MTVAVVMPWRAGCEHREHARIWTTARYSNFLPDAEIVIGGCDPTLPFNRAEAILDAAGRTEAETLVVADADCWSDGLTDALTAMHEGAKWAVPHYMMYRLTEAATERLLDGESEPSRWDVTERPYKGHETGTLLVITRALLLDVPPDRRFVGWGQEDDAWAAALHTLAGPPWRGLAPLVHLWHPPQPRKTRRVGTEANLRLYWRYERARDKPDWMRALIDEARWS